MSSVTTMFSYVLLVAALSVCAWADSSSSDDGFPVYERPVKPYPQWPAKGTLHGQYDFRVYDGKGEIEFCLDTNAEKFAKIFYDQTEVSQFVFKFRNMYLV